MKGWNQRRVFLRKKLARQREQYSFIEKIESKTRTLDKKIESK